ncbi:corticotropin-releasing factor-binding protein [Lepeophtheirus salmonis]|uniref:Corticotropin releasing hormone binding proteinlike [Tribolium castaneum] n=1 Tax=Lepeophtheirus salmonis TaxID=72036 RepID=A0A0K2V9H9_LEPSM|nr:corticotropin-releasing factor-binding protein-like [Lepeophtheirus salmonis]
MKTNSGYNILIFLFSTFLVGSSFVYEPKEIFQNPFFLKYAQRSTLPSPSMHKRQEIKHSAHKDAISSIPVTECMTVLMENGKYHFVSNGDDTVCGVYLASDANSLIEVEFTDYNVACESGGLISFFDGWELNEKVFPSKHDHPIDFNDRFKEFCSKGSFDEKNRKTLRFVASQNAAVIQYRIPTKGEGFSFTFNDVLNLEPCNVLMTVNQGTFSLRNEGRPKNCSLTTLLFPANLKIVNMNVGINKENEKSFEVSSKSMKNKRVDIPCHQRSNEDYIEFGGSAQLDSSELSMKQTLCGIKTEASTKALTILCGSTTVRLVSSGRYDNTLTVDVKEAEEEDLNQSTNYIMMCPDYL